MTGTRGNPVRLGTRRSPLARAQCELAAERLRAVDPALAESGAIEIVPIKTTGDRITDRPLHEVGGKGLFAKEIEAALLDGEIDIAVHSLKDLETRLPAGLVIAGVLEREDPRDALIYRAGARIADLPRGAVVGTASIRREAQLRAMRDDLEITMLRGNVQTRIERVRNGDIDATLLAMAGLRRLGGLPEEATPILPETLLPAPGQGTIALQCRANDDAARTLVAAASDARSWTETTAERALLTALDGSCRTPVGALARQEESTLNFDAMVAAPDGSRVIRARRVGPVSDAERIGRAVGNELKAQADPAWFLE